MSRKFRKSVTYMSTIIVCLICLVGFLLAFIPGRMTKDHTEKIVSLYLEDMEYELDDDIDALDNIIKEKLIADDGHSIPVYSILADQNYDNKTIILVHWHESNYKSMIPMAEIFLKKGFNVVLYDAPAHGDNTAKRVSFGYYEKEDLKKVVDYVEGKMTEKKLIGALGQSMGASTVGYYSGTVHGSEHLDFAIIDSGFTSMDEEIAWQINKSPVPMPTELLVRLGSEANNLIYGYHYEDVNIVEAIKKNNIPTLIIHSKKDKKCPYSMGEKLFESIPHDRKDLITFENSKHLEAFWDENEKYQKVIWEFIKKYGYLN